MFEDTTSTVQDTKPIVPVPQQITTPTQEQLKHQLDLKRLELEFEERNRKMELDRKALELNNRSTGQSCNFQS